MARPGPGVRDDRRVTDFPTRLFEEWDIPRLASIRRAESGTMNETWLLEWPDGRAVLRRHRRSVRAEIEFEHRVLRHARSGGVACPAVLPTGRGAALVEEGGRFYSLYTWAPGSQLPRGGLGGAHARSMGLTLARIHLVLADLPGGPEAHDPLSPVEQTLERIGTLLHLARGRPDQARLHVIVEGLEARWRWLRAHPLPAPTQQTATAQLIHGDYQDANVFFERGEVSCVIDWDKARREVPARELVRAMDHGLGMEPLLCRAFLTGYRRLLPMPLNQLEEAADRFTHQQAHSLWLTEQILLHDNDRAARLMGNQPFVPFSQRWRAAALS